jgi:hypothetical protein
MIVFMTVGGLSSLKCGSKQCTDTITGAVVVCFDDSETIFSRVPPRIRKKGGIDHGAHCFTCLKKLLPLAASPIHSRFFLHHSPRTAPSVGLGPHWCARSLSSSPYAGLLSALVFAAAPPRALVFTASPLRAPAFAGHPHARLSLSRRSCPCERCLRQPPPRGRPQQQTPLPHPCPPPPTPAA